MEPPLGVQLSTTVALASLSMETAPGLVVAMDDGVGSDQLVKVGYIYYVVRIISDYQHFLLQQCQIHVNLILVMSTQRALEIAY